MCNPYVAGLVSVVVVLESTSIFAFDELLPSTRALVGAHGGTRFSKHLRVGTNTYPNLLALNTVR